MKQRSLAILLLLASVVIFFQVSAIAHAASPAPFRTLATATQCTLPDGSPGLIDYSDSQPTCCPPGQSSAQACLYAKYINPVIALLSVAIGLIVVIVLVYGAIEYITSGGDPQRAAAAKTRIMNALIALVAFILLYAFLKFILPGGSN